MTVIRAGLESFGVAAAVDVGRAGGVTLHLGLIAHHERAGEPAGAGGDDGQEQQGERGEP